MQRIKSWEKAAKIVLVLMLGSASGYALALTPFCRQGEKPVTSRRRRLEMETEKKRKTYDRQFKLDAVNLVVNGGRSVSEAARELGINPNVLHRWKRHLTEDGTDAFPGKGRLGPQEEELRRLRRELEQAKEDRDILKKALAFFSKGGK
jgi:transposase